MAPTPTTSSNAAAAQKNNEKLSDSLKLCNEILEELFSKKLSSFAWPFYRPMDAEILGVHYYYNIIPNPMDLNKVKRKMDSREYKTAEEFADDVRTIFSNCYTYLPSNYVLVAKARNVEHFFEKSYAKISKKPIGSGLTTTGYGTGIGIGNQPTDKTIESDMEFEEEKKILNVQIESSSDEELDAKIKVFEDELLDVQIEICKLKEEIANEKRIKKGKRPKSGIQECQCRKCKIERLNRA